MVVFASAYMEMAGECLAAEHCTLSHPRVLLHMRLPWPPCLLADAVLCLPRIPCCKALSQLRLHKVPMRNACAPCFSCWGLKCGQSSLAAQPRCKHCWRLRCTLTPRHWHPALR